VSWFRPRDHNIFFNVGSLLLCGLLAGVVVAAALFPSVAMSGLLAKESLEQFDQLPAELTVREGAQVTYVYAADGKTLLTSMYDEHRRNLDSLEGVGETMVNAILAAEDNNFYEHNGVDTRGIMRALVANVAADEVTQGASTVTQQFVRLSLTYFAPDLEEVVDATEDTTGRKLREARLAIAVEKQMSKDEILLRYLNLAYFGEGAYGVFAAAQVYFGKKPTDLKIEEAALLAGMVRAPSQYAPGSEEGRPVVRERRDWVIDQMVSTGAITRAEAAEAKAVPLEVEPKRPKNMCVGVKKNNWGFFCDMFYRWWLGQEEFGASRWEREQRLRAGGYHIVTTLDPKIQKIAKQTVESQIPTRRKEWRALMAAVIEPGTGKVRAMATNRNFKLDDPDDPKNGPHTNPKLRKRGLRGTYPNTTNPLISGGGDIDGYQAGSTFKLFTTVAALESGLPLNTSINSPPQVTTSFYAEPGTGAACGSRWCPHNYPGQPAGSYNLWTAFGSSINTYFAQLIDRVGAEKAVDAAKRMGIKFRASGTEERPQDAQFASPQRSHGWGPFTLGVSATVPLDLANAYATVSAEGIHCEPVPVEKIRTPDGDVLEAGKTDCERVLKRDVALAAIDAGRCVTGMGSKLGGCPPGRGTIWLAHDEIGKPVWGKSGTSDEYRTYTNVLSTKQLSVAVQLVDPDWAQTDKRMDSEPVRTTSVGILRKAMKGMPSEDWDVPSDKDLIRGPEINIAGVTCQSVGQAQSRLEGQGFKVEISDQPVDSDCAPGRVAGTRPSGTTSPGDTITILISNGSGYDPGNGGGNDRTEPPPNNPQPEPDPSAISTCPPPGCQEGDSG
jgi:membrane peptidoglycan carboxypeptidase